jgi:hypothetical protein
MGTRSPSTLTPVEDAPSSEAMALVPALDLEWGRPPDVPRTQRQQPPEGLVPTLDTQRPPEEGPSIPTTSPSTTTRQVAVQQKPTKYAAQKWMSSDREASCLLNFASYHGIFAGTSDEESDAETEPAA